MRAARAVAVAVLLAVMPLTACVDLAAVQAESEGAAFKGGRRSETPTLMPLRQIHGARLASRVDANGVVLPGSEPAVLQPFIRPVAVALRGGELYVVDAGAGAVYRVDAGSDTMSAFVGAPARIGVRIDAGSDRSLYIADPVQRRVSRFTSSGRLVHTLAAPIDIMARPGALAVDERRGFVVVADASFNQLVMLPLLGGAAYPVVPRGAGGRMTKLESVAAGADGFYATDLLCRCVTLFAPNGTVIAVFGQETLVRPGPIAIDGNERVFVGDHGDGTVKVFSGGRQIAAFTGSQLGVSEISDLAVDEGTLAIADGGGAKIALLRLLAAVPTAVDDR